MRMYLSGIIEHISTWGDELINELLSDMNVLQSFAYYQKNNERLYPLCKSLMLDSGAFTVMNNKHKRNDFNPLEYTKAYAEHIKKNNIDLFLEMDIEGVFGFDVYKDCLHCLQDITGKDPIYVFHKWRGLDYYKELVKKYNFIALGDVSVGSGSRELYKYFPWFLEEAHKNNCRVHGLAFTSLKDLQFMPFDSVDSSSWSSGCRFARPSRFDGHNLLGYDLIRNDARDLPTSTTFRKHDIPEWKKLSQYYDEEYEPIW